MSDATYISFLTCPSTCRMSAVAVRLGSPIVIYCFSFELPLLLYTSHPEAEREGETHLTEHDLAVISCT